MVPLLTIGGRIAKGFDFLRYSFEPKGVSIAPKTLANFLDRMTQLYERGADHRRIGKYVRNRWRWVRASVEISVMNVSTVSHFASPPQLPNPTRGWEKLLVFFQFHTTPRNQTSAKKIIDLLIRNNIVC